MSDNTSVAGLSHATRRTGGKSTPIGALAVALAMLCLMGCATSEERGTLARGTMTSPPPAAARPGVGAPVVGQPAPHADAVPRSPHARVLPETPETRRHPGIWATTVPLDGPVVQRVRLPYPPNATSDLEREATDKCATGLNDTIRKFALEPEYAKLTTEEKDCVVAQLYYLCTTGMMNDHRRAKAEGTAFDAGRYAARQAADRTAESFASEKCPDDVRKSKPVARVFRLTAERWMPTVGH